MDGMLKNETGIPLAKALSLPDGKGLNEVYLNIMLEEDLPVLYVNQSNYTRKLTPFKPLYGGDHAFWRKSGDGEYFLTGYGLERLKELALARTGAWHITAADEKILGEMVVEDNAEEEETGFGIEYDNFAEMSVEEKIERLSQDKIRLNELIIKKSKDHIAISEALASTAKDTAMINHTVLKEIVHFAHDQAKAYSREVVIYTNEIVMSSARLLSENIFSDELMKTITAKSKGIVFQHITRVYLNGSAFLAYFNNKISSSSAIIKIRTSFNLKYRKFYHALLPHIDDYDLTVDNVFMEGLKIISPELLFKWSVGFLLHDLGKAADIEYHEGNAGYNRTKVVDHVKIGYRSITEKTNYPREASLIVGYHHEYYGDPDGYGSYRDDLDEYKSQIADVKQNYCITYEADAILDFKALAYFPAKILEIIDVYDSLTDPRRVYRRSMPSEEALSMMYREFIIKRHKIDPILFDIFTGFIHEKEVSAANEK